MSLRLTDDDGRGSRLAAMMVAEVQIKPEHYFVKEHYS